MQRIRRMPYSRNMTCDPPPTSRMENKPIREPQGNSCRVNMITLKALHEASRPNEALGSLHYDGYCVVVSYRVLLADA